MARKPQIFEPATEPVPPVIPPPPDGKAIYAELLAAEQLPQVTNHEKEVKERRQKAARKAWADYQNPAPVLQLTADQIVKSHRWTQDEIRIQRLRFRARADRDIAWLLKMYDEKLKP